LKVNDTYTKRKFALAAITCTTFWTLLIELTLRTLAAPMLAMVELIAVTNPCPPRGPDMPKKKKKEIVPTLKVPKNATLKQIYAAYKKQFTAADLQKYTVIEPMVPATQLLAELEAIHAEETQKRNKRKKK
jgi:hypothetical protein